MEGLEFQLYRQGADVILKYILDDPVALRKWPICINLFLRSKISRMRLYDKFKHEKYYETIMDTLQEWLEEQGSKATFGELIQLLRHEQLNSLCDVLLENSEMIKNVQSQHSKAPFVSGGGTPKVWFGMADVPGFVGRVKDLERLHKLVTKDRTEEHSAITLLTSVHGFGGIGKTTLARMYAWKYRNEFDGNVIWIDAETFDSMRNAFQKIAVKLNLAAVKKTNLALNDLTESLYKSLGDSKCLFIFDNAVCFHGQDGVEQFLPSGIIRKPYLLLTSRKTDCFPTNRILPLDFFSQPDSTQLIKVHMPGATNEIAAKLADTLKRFPLALHLAVAYVQKSIPRYSLSLETCVSKEINYFLEDYENNSNKIMNSEFIGEDRYVKNISTLCEMILRRMELEEGGKLAKHMMRYISFLHPSDVQLDFLLKLDYRFESIWDKLHRSIPWNTGMIPDPNMTVDLLCRYSLVDINATERTIKVHRLVQDATRFILRQKEELPYVERLLACLTKDKCGENLSHWISIQRSCRNKDTKRYVQTAIPQSIQLQGHVSSAGFNIDPSEKLEEVFSYHKFTSLIIPILIAMKDNHINKSLETYLDVYYKIKSVSKAIQGTNLLLTNYVVFSNFIVSEEHKNIFQSVFECVSMLRMSQFKINFLLDLLGEEFYPDDVRNFLDILNITGVTGKSTDPKVVIFNVDFLHLFNEYLQFKSLCNEFPCLNYLKSPSSITNFNELQALNLSWDFRNSSIWPILSKLEFNLEAVRPAIAYICDSQCGITKYLEIYKAEEYEMDDEYKKPEIIVQFVNAKLLRHEAPKQYEALARNLSLVSDY